MSRLSLKKPTKDSYDKGKKLVFVGTKLIMSWVMEGLGLAIHLGLFPPVPLKSLSSTFSCRRQSGNSCLSTCLRTAVCIAALCKAIGPREQDSLTHIDRSDDGWDRAGRRPAGPKLNRSLS